MGSREHGTQSLLGKINEVYNKSKANLMIWFFYFKQKAALCNKEFIFVGKIHLSASPERCIMGIIATFSSVYTTCVAQI